MMDFKNVIFIADKILYTNKGNLNRLEEKFEKIIQILEEKGTYIKSLTLVGGRVSELCEVFQEGVEDHKYFSPICLFCPLDKPFFAGSIIKGENRRNCGCLLGMNAALFAESLTKGMNENMNYLKIHNVKKTINFSNSKFSFFFEFFLKLKKIENLDVEFE